jgi:hypothetical protein
VRCRIVTEQNGETFVSSTVMTLAEAHESLDYEVFLHEKGGWTVTRSADVVVARRRRSLRVLTIRVSDPMTDTIERSNEQ